MPPRFEASGQLARHGDREVVGRGRFGDEDTRLLGELLVRRGEDFPGEVLCMRARVDDAWLCQPCANAGGMPAMAVTGEHQLVPEAAPRMPRNGTAKRFGRLAHREADRFRLAAQRAPAHQRVERLLELGGDVKIDLCHVLYSTCVCLSLIHISEPTRPY